MEKINVTDRNGFPVAAEIRDAVAAEPIFWSDKQRAFYFFDFLLPCGLWCECIRINEEQNEFIVNLSNR